MRPADRLLFQAQQQGDTLIPLLYHRHGTLAAAMDQALDILRVSSKSLEEAALQLRSRYSHNSEFRTQLEKFITGRTMRLHRKHYLEASHPFSGVFHYLQSTLTRRTQFTALARAGAGSAVNPYVAETKSQFEKEMGKAERGWIEESM